MPRRDSGASFIELLVAVVLIGTAVIATLAALQATVIGTTVERDHAKAHQWMQSASGVLEAQSTPFENCIAPTPADIPAAYATIRSKYQTAIQTGADKPQGFVSVGQLTVTNVDVWNGTAWVPFLSQTECLDNNSLRQQLVTISAANNKASIVETVEVVKHG